MAQETLVIWCPLASRLGLWAMKAELEDLCFAVIQVFMYWIFCAQLLAVIWRLTCILLCMQPQVFRKMRADLASMWSPTNRAGNPRRMLARASISPFDEKSVSANFEGSITMDEDMKNLKVSSASCLFIFHILRLDEIAGQLTSHSCAELAICIDKYLTFGDVNSLMFRWNGNTLLSGLLRSFYLSHFTACMFSSGALIWYISSQK